MITLNELKSGFEVTGEHLQNLQQLCDKLNIIRAAYDKPLRVSSGYRSLEHHLHIYAQKGITDQSKIPMKSKHLTGCAADLVPLSDSIENFHAWIKEREYTLIADTGLWIESFAHTKSWVHLQSAQYASWTEGKSRFFIP